jgi:N-acetylglucosamine kinase-like BadF-type ATPase
MGTRRAAILAVDAGGSKIDVALLRRDGTVLGAARLQVSNHSGTGTGTEEHLLQVVDAVQAAALDAGIDPSRLPVADLGIYCLAGADLPADDRRLSKWLGRRGLTATDVVRNDTFAVLRAGTERPWGIGVVCGYGTNCAGVAPDGRITRFPAVGTISGDWGGGADLGRAAIWYAIRAEDGRGSKTMLASTVPAFFGMRRPRQVLEGLYFGRLDEERIVGLAPIVFEAATAGDAIALGLVERQADEVAVMATTAMRRLRMTKLDPDVVLGGGIFRTRNASFFERIDASIHVVAPRANVHVLTDPPVVGAALLGLDRLGAPHAAQARARRNLTHDRLSAHTAG